MTECAHARVARRARRVVVEVLCSMREPFPSASARQNGRCRAYHSGDDERLSRPYSRSFRVLYFLFRWEDCMHVFLRSVHPRRYVIASVDGMPRCLRVRWKLMCKVRKQANILTIVAGVVMVFKRDAVLRHATPSSLQGVPRLLRKTMCIYAIRRRLALKAVRRMASYDEL